MLKKYDVYSDYKDKNSQKDLFSGLDEQIERVREIIHDVRCEGDEAIKKFTRLFDHVDVGDLIVSEEEIARAVKEVNPSFIESIRLAKRNIEIFHRHQLQHSWWDSGPGVVVGQCCRPLESVGAYIPGGTASLSSSVLMTVIPAKIAGVNNIYLCTPPGKDGLVNPETLVAAYETGVSRVFKVGGAQAIAAFAYGTETIPVVSKIIGPGNIYVTIAKKEVFGKVGIDMLAGPSEIVVVADDFADPEYIAADLLSQAEHDVYSRSILVTNSHNLARAVNESLGKLLMEIPRKEIAEESLLELGAIIIVSSIDEAIDVVNDIAPEHVELHIDQAWSYLDKVKNAGAIFIGPYTPESLGDYLAGSNHVLPTGGAARYASALGVYDYVKWSNILYYSSEALEEAAKHVKTLAEAEGLAAHANAALIRRKKNETSGRN